MTNKELKIKPRLPHSKYSLSRWGQGNEFYDDVARQLNGNNKCCIECGASTSIRLLDKNGVCPDCNGDAARLIGENYRSPFLENQSER